MSKELVSKLFERCTIKYQDFLVSEQEAQYLAYAHTFQESVGCLILVCKELGVEYVGTNNFDKILDMMDKVDEIVIPILTKIDAEHDQSLEDAKDVVSNLSCLKVNNG